MKQTNFLKMGLCLVTAAALIGCASPGTTYSRSTGRYIDDSSTTSRIKSALSKDSLVKATEVEVSTFRGNVHLTGFVDHPVQKERAAQITRNVEGVEWFKNDILVKSELPSGRVSAGQQMEEPAGAAREPKRGWSSLKESGWQKGNTGDTYAPQPRSEGDLSQRISNQLRSDHPQAAQNVRIETSPDGKVTLRGAVSSRDEKNAIEKKVESIAGVKDVDNKLEVQSP